VELWEKLNMDLDDELVILGDIVDRGPDPKKIVNFILERRREGFQIVVLRGNHEDMYINYLRGEQSIPEAEIDNLPITFLWNGGGKTIKSFGKNGPSRVHTQFLTSTKLFYETEKYIFVHAGLRPHCALEDQKPADLMWIREDFLDVPYDFGKRVVFGHTPTRYINKDRTFAPYFDQYKIGIDTGCVYGGYLTAVRLPSESIVQVSCVEVPKQKKKSA
jgi:serine/threonine protein phosphatase 1